MFQTLISSETAELAKICCTSVAREICNPTICSNEVSRLLFIFRIVDIHDKIPDIWGEISYEKPHNQV